MLKLLWNVVPTKFKVGMGITLIVFISAIGGYMWYQGKIIESLRAEVVKVRTETTLKLQFYEMEIENAHNAINRQNQAIHSLRFEKDVYEQRVTQAKEELQQNWFNNQKEIIIEIQRDSTAENQLQLIETILRRYSNAR